MEKVKHLLKRLQNYCQEAWKDLDKTPEWLITREGWGAERRRPDMEPVDCPVEVMPDVLPWPLKWVVIHSILGYEDPGPEPDNIHRTLREMQENDMEENECDDIRYNFIIGGDGYVYEGAGWERPGSHTWKYNEMSIGVAFLGDPRTPPRESMVTAARRLIEEGLRKRYLRGDVRIVPHSQLVEGAECPSKQLLETLQEAKVLDPDRNCSEWSWLWTCKRWIDQLPDLFRERWKEKVKEWKQDWKESPFRTFINYTWNN